jgi:hypothetical protein
MVTSGSTPTMAELLGNFLQAHPTYDATSLGAALGWGREATELALVSQGPASELLAAALQGLATGPVTTVIASVAEAWDPPQVGSNVENTDKTVVAPGARPGDFVLVSWEGPEFHVMVGLVDAPDQVRIGLANMSGNALNLSPGTVRVLVLRAP